MSRFVRVGLWTAAGVVIALLAIELRIAGLFRGLAAGYIFHPDEPKQIHALGQYLHGSYLWYVGNWFYDGYPYGLNHLDEWILRAVLPLKQTALHATLPEYAAPEQQSRIDLYYWGRALRACYGLIVVLCTLGVASLLRAGRAGVMWAGALSAVAPLSITVTHFATGDIGVDLFAGLSLLFIAAHTRRPAIGWLIASGLMVGLAFGCKYNGLLAALPVALYVSLRAWDARRLPRWIGEGVLAAIGAFAGVLISTPALLISWTRTWTDIFTNLDRIRWYNAEKWRELPFSTRVVESVGANFPRVLTALGWSLCLGALAGSVLLARAWWHAQRVPGKPEQGATEAARLAICTYPLIALAISLAGKPMVQPFHFSYLVAPLVLGCVCAATAARAARIPAARLAGSLLLGVALLETGLHAKREHFFWRRDDILALKPFVTTVMDAPDTRHKSAVKLFFLEPANMSGFRNEPVVIRLKDGFWWRTLEVAPLPAVPYPVDCDWIFMNGVEFPRSDRLFRVAGDRVSAKQLVFNGTARPFKIGLRAGSWPVHVTASAGGKKFVCDLVPDEERIVELEPGRARKVKRGEPGGEETQLLPLRVAADVGDVWVTVLETARETEVYRAFGPRASEANPAALAGMLATDTDGRLTQLKLTERDERPPLAVTGPANGQAGWLLSAGAEIPFTEVNGGIHPVLARGDCSSMLRKLTAGSVALPAGAYMLDCELTVAEGGAELSFGVGDPCDLPGVGPAPQSFSLEPGTQHVVYRFNKQFSPYECFVWMRCQSGRGQLITWRLRPDVPRLQADMQRWQTERTMPAWAAPAPRKPLPAEVLVSPGVAFNHRIVMEQVAFPAKLTAGDIFPMRWKGALMGGSVPRFGDYDVFVHLIAPDGTLTFSSGFPLFEGMARGTHGAPANCGTLRSDMPAGTYELRVGLWSRETLQRLTAQARGDSQASIHDDTVVLGSVEVGK